MNETLLLIFAFLAGIVLGLLFFYGLWLTVKHAFSTKIPALWFTASSILRTGITLAGFYYVSKGNLQLLLVCVAGFFTARFVAKRFTGLAVKNRLQIEKEVSHES